MPEPKRLTLEEDALAAALRAERVDAAALPVRALRTRVVAAVAAGAVPLSSLAALTAWSARGVFLAVVAAGALGVGGGALGHAAWIARASSPSAAPATANAPVPSSSAPIPTPGGVLGAPTPPSGASLAPDEPRAAPASAPVSAPVTARAPAPAASDPASRDPGALAEELSLFERGQGALDEGRPAVAARELRAYLDAFPEGRMRHEATEGLVEALVRSGRFEDAVEEATRATREGSARPALRLAELQALTALGRCAEALKLVDTLGTAAASDERVRRARARCPAGPTSPPP